MALNGREYGESKHAERDVQGPALPAPRLDVIKPEAMAQLTQTSGIEVIGLKSVN